MGKGVERNSGATEIRFEATLRFAVVEVKLVLGLVDFGGTDEKVLVRSESGFRFRFRSDSIVRVWNN